MMIDGTKKKNKNRSHGWFKMSRSEQFLCFYTDGESTQTPFVFSNSSKQAIKTVSNKPCWLAGWDPSAVNGFFLRQLPDISASMEMTDENNKTNEENYRKRSSEKFDVERRGNRNRRWKGKCATFSYRSFPSNGKIIFSNTVTITTFAVLFGRWPQTNTIWCDRICEIIKIGRRIIHKTIKSVIGDASLSDEDEVCEEVGKAKRRAKTPHLNLVASVSFFYQFSQMKCTCRLPLPTMCANPTFSVSFLSTHRIYGIELSGFPLVWKNSCWWR